MLSWYTTCMGSTYTLHWFTWPPLLEILAPTGNAASGFCYIYLSSNIANIQPRRTQKVGTCITSYAFSLAYSLYLSVLRTVSLLSSFPDPRSDPISLSSLASATIDLTIKQNNTPKNLNNFKIRLLILVLFAWSFSYIQGLLSYFSCPFAAFFEKYR